MSDVRFVKGGTLVGRDEAAACSVLVAGAGISEPSTVHAFSSEEDFRVWLASSSAKKRLLALDTVVTRTRAEAAVGEAWSAARLQGSAELAVAALYELGERHLLQPSSEELLRKVTSETGSTPARFPSLMVLFDANELGGAWRPVDGVVPHLEWIGFDDRTSSLWLAGAGVLGQHPWFGGQRIYMLGAPWIRFDRLRDFGFDNCASSAAVL